jgi:ATP-binding cassette subfamily B protein
MYETSHSKFRIEALSSFFDYGFWGVFMFGEIVALVLVLVVGVKGVFEGTVTIGTLVAFLQYIQMMFQPIMQLSEQLNFVQRSLISVERVLGILETEPSISDGPRAAGDLSFDGEIKFENVWFAYKHVERDDGGSATEPPEWEWVLKDVSFTIPKGETYALVGASGGGKSTIVNLLLRFYDPQQGRILVDGQDIREFPVKAWRERIGLVLQDVFLFPGSVADNLRVFDDNVPLEHVRKSAELTFASRIIEHLPDSYEGELAERGGNLSVGERQLIASPGRWSMTRRCWCWMKRHRASIRIRSGWCRSRLSACSRAAQR